MKWNNKITKKFQWERLEFSTWNPESTAWNPESKTVMDSLSRGETKGQEIQYIFTGSFTSSARVRHVMNHVPCSFFGPNLHDFDFLFSTSWLIMARPTLAIPPSRNCANYKKWDVAKERLLLSFILSKGYKVKFLKSFAKKGMYLMRSWRNTLDWKLSHQKIRRRLL